MKFINLKKIAVVFSITMLLVSCSRNGDFPSEVIQRGLKGHPKTILEKSFANDSMLALEQPENYERWIEFDQKGYIVKSLIYAENKLAFFSEADTKHGDTLITNGFLKDSTMVSITKQWVTSDTTLEIHEFEVKDGAIIGEFSTIKTILNHNKQPKKESIITDTGTELITEIIYFGELAISQYQSLQFSEPFVINYRYLEYDEYNNWTMRQCIINEENGKSNVSYQAREITYFE